MDSCIAAWQDQIRQAAVQRQTLKLQGSGSKQFCSPPGSGLLLDTRAHAGIVDYQPRELVVTARAGTSLALLERELTAQGQQLPFEPPHFGPDATLGGCIAAGLAGPARPYTGSVRDYVLGVRLLDGQAQHLRFGGTVMKNVAGYDVSRLLTGSWGSLGLLTEISLKVLPQPAVQVTQTWACTQAEALNRMNHLARQPWPITATSWQAGQLRVRLAGSRTAVAAAQQQLGGETDPDTVFWSALREQRPTFFTQPLWRLSVKSTAPVCPLGDCWLEWGGALRWLATEASGTEIGAWARQQGGTALPWRQPAAARVALPALPATHTALQARIKAVFDPAGVFSPYPA